MLNLTIHDAPAMEQLGAALARVSTPPLVIFLYGDLGAGKTTLIRGFLRELGVTGPIKSPTYQLVESYAIAGKMVYHFDLYRLRSPKELMEAGLRDYLASAAIWLFEWPEKAKGLLPTADLCLHLDIVGEARTLRIAAHSNPGKSVLDQLCL
jgi:tRNA threonylcarbamoyladenosine biosynthesis protein TsaE